MCCIVEEGGYLLVWAGSVGGPIWGTLTLPSKIIYDAVRYIIILGTYQFDIYSDLRYI